MSQMNLVRILIYYCVCLRPVLFLSSHSSLGVFLRGFFRPKLFAVSVYPCLLHTAPILPCFIILITLGAVNDTSSFHLTSYCCVFGEFPCSDTGPETDRPRRQVFHGFPHHIQAVVGFTFQPSLCRYRAFCMVNYLDQCTACILTMNFYIVVLHVLMHLHHLQGVLFSIC
jgi:hypothetical protein